MTTTTETKSYLLKPQTLMASNYQGHEIEFTIESTGKDTVLISWPQYPYLNRYGYQTDDNKGYYRIVTRGSNKALPNYGTWKKGLAADLETADDYFLGVRMTHRLDTLAAYDNLLSSHIPASVLLAACQYLIKNHNAHLKQAKMHLHSNPLMVKAAPKILSILKNYQTDFTYHDAMIIGESQAQSAIIAVAESHTFIIANKHGVDDRTLVKNTWRKLDKSHRYFVITPDECREIDAADLDAKIDRL
jgi:hypothetical protein